ncbi:hypothetical protein [Chelativorans intermedius]|uniref:Uncharacterized protein n=1 Tax=Chelativorans intermedius TaxID=515947 RepID=A0ABV6D7Q9_9HYPH|nr:hypothetical protein [Chelativorans intermedius]MCT8999791.1 hypothetical protein [Chelativorans intermedius]
MPGRLLVIIFLLSMALVLYGWWQILALAFHLEKRRFGWSDEEALTKFVSLRRPRGRQGRKRMHRYIREDLRAHAEATGQWRRHRNARLALSAGYAAAAAAVFTWVLSTVLESW